MARASRQSHKVLPPIDIDEMLNSPAMNGLISVLAPPPAEWVAKKAERDAKSHEVLRQLRGLPSSSGIPNEVPQSSKGIPNDGDGSTTTSTTVALANPNFALSGESAQTLGTPDDPHRRSWTIQLERKRLRPYRTRLAQDGHSKSEQALYELLWKEGRPVDGSASRYVIAGYGELMRKAKLGRNTIIRALVSLAKKLAIRKVQDCGQKGSRYEILNYTEILKLRESAGLVWAVKDRDGVALLRPQDFDQKFITQEHSLGIPNKILPGIPVKPSPGIPDDAAGIPIKDASLGTPGIPNERPPLYSLKFFKDVVDDVEHRLAGTEFRDFDRQAIETIWRQGREVVPDLTPEEMCEVFLERARVAARNRRTENLNGLILFMWKNWLTPVRIEQLRAEKRQQAERQSETNAEIEESARRMLNDAQATEAEKNIARQILGIENVGFLNVPRG